MPAIMSGTFIVIGKNEEDSMKSPTALHKIRPSPMFCEISRLQNEIFSTQCGRIKIQYLF